MQIVERKNMCIFSVHKQCFRMKKILLLLLLSIEYIYIRYPKKKKVVVCIYERNSKKKILKLRRYHSNESNISFTLGQRQKKKKSFSRFDSSVSFSFIQSSIFVHFEFSTSKKFAIFQILITKKYFVYFWEDSSLYNFNCRFSSEFIYVLSCFMFAQSTKPNQTNHLNRNHNKKVNENCVCCVCVFVYFVLKVFLLRFFSGIEWTKYSVILPPSVTNK